MLLNRFDVLHFQVVLGTCQTLQNWTKIDESRPKHVGTTQLPQEQLPVQTAKRTEVKCSRNSEFACCNLCKVAA